MPNRAAAEANGIVISVLEDFLRRLTEEHALDGAAIGRLRETLLDNGESSPDKLRKALFAEDLE